MKRKLKWTAVVLAVSLLGFGTAFLLWPRDRITRESWQKIRIGMTEDEAAEILGGPGMTDKEFRAENDRLGKELGQRPWQPEGLIMEEPKFVAPTKVVHKFVDFDRAKTWMGRRGMIVIEWDKDNNVCWKHFVRLRWINEGILDRLRDWLGW